MDPWPIEEAAARPIATLALALVVPIASARALALVLLPARPGGAERRAGLEDAHERAVHVAPFRAACFVVGIAQLQLAWLAGATALGPAWIARPHAVEAEIFAALTTLAAFVAGGVGRLVERERAGSASDLAVVRDAILLRLRLGTYFLGPLVVVHAASRLPLLDDAGALRIEVSLAAVALVVAGVAYGGLAALLVTGAIRRPSVALVSAARRAAEREGVRLLGVWRLPTGSVPFANAAAIPWARVMVVTDRITAILEEDELDAVLAHEAAHLSEAPWVALVRVGTASLLVVGLVLGPTLLSAMHVSATTQLGALAVLVLTGLAALWALRDLARRMEERADEHARAHVGPDALARALEKIHADALAPHATGRKRVHPDLHDRLAACGRVLERPEPPRTRVGVVAGLALATALGTAAWLADTLTALPPSEAELASPDAAWRRLRVDPWDGGAALALAWQARRREDLSRAERYATEAARLGVAGPPLLELEAELWAARGDCDRARATFDRALAARVVDPLESSLELGGYRIPPSLILECGMGDPQDVDGVVPRAR